MARLKTRKAFVAGLAALTLFLAAGLYAVAQQAMDEAKRDRAVAVAAASTTCCPPRSRPRSGAGSTRGAAEGQHRTPETPSPSRP